MIVHIAIFKWKETISKKEIKQATADIRELKFKVNGLVDVLCGENFSRWNEGFTHAVVVIAKDRNALEAYRKHPDHKDVASRIEQMETKSIGIDFETK